MYLIVYQYHITLDTSNGIWRVGRNLGCKVLLPTLETNTSIVSGAAVRLFRESTDGNAVPTSDTLFAPGLSPSAFNRSLPVHDILIVSFSFR